VIYEPEVDVNLITLVQSCPLLVEDRSLNTRRSPEYAFVKGPVVDDTTVFM
jgi:hypothetical protein